MTLATRVLEDGSGTAEQTGGRGRIAQRDLPRRLLVPGIVLASMAVAVWIYWIAGHTTAMWATLDLAIYQDGGREAAHGHNLYNDTYSWVHLPFTYPPFAALVFAAVSDLAFGVLQVVMTSFSFLSLLTVCWLSWGKLGYRPSAGRAGATLLTASFALWTEPVQQTLSFGQVNLVLMVIVLLDLSIPDGHRLKGAGIGLAAGFKLVPAVFIPYLFLTRQTRAAYTSLAAFGATVAGTFLVIPHESWQYWDGTFFDSARVGTVDYVGNQSMHGWIYRMLRGDSLVQPVWLVAAVLVCGLGLLLAARQYKSGNELLSILTTALTGLLCSPISWSHHWVWITVALVLAAEWAWRSRRPVRALLPIALFLLYAAWLQQQFWMGIDEGLVPTGLIWRLPNNNNLEYTWRGFQVVQGDMYTYIGLIFMLCLVVHWVRTRRTASVAGSPLVSPVATADPAE